LGAGAEGCGPALGCGWADAALAGGTVAAGAGSVARGSTFAAATTDSGFSGRSGRDGVKGAAGDGAGGLWGIGDAFGGVFSAVRVTVALFAEALAGVIGGGIAARCG
jgi:hypothetical protein